MKLETGKQNNGSENNTPSARNTGQGRNETKDRVKDKKGDMVNPTPGDDMGSSRLMERRT